MATAGGHGLRIRHRLWLPVLLLAGMEAGAVRVSDVPLYATLDAATVARLASRDCVAAEGSHVELVAEVAGPGVVAGADRRWFARVITGPCARAEAVVAESALRDQRATPEPTPPRPPAR